jgi:hypothetical protein
VPNEDHPADRTSHSRNSPRATRNAMWCPFLEREPRLAEKYPKLIETKAEPARAIEAKAHD